MGSNDGDELIEQTAKRLISEGFHLISKNMAAFAYLFGKEELKRLNHYAFDYVCVGHDLTKNHNYKKVAGEVFNLSDIMAYAVLKQYKLMRIDRRSIKIEYPKESELERMVKNGNIEVRLLPKES